MDQLKDKLEPESITKYNEYDPQLSIAISLKRIADMLESTRAFNGAIKVQKA